MNAYALKMKSKSGSTFFDNGIMSQPEGWATSSLHAIGYKISARTSLSKFSEKTYYLSDKEQAVFRKALRRSVKIIHKA